MQPRPKIGVQSLALTACSNQERGQERTEAVRRTDTSDWGAIAAADRPAPYREWDLKSRIRHLPSGSIHSFDNMLLVIWLGH